MSDVFGTQKKPRKDISLKSAELILIAALLLIANISLIHPALLLAATDPCAALKPEEISKTLGDTFGAPTKQSTPPGPFADTLTRCEYQGKKLTFALTIQEYPNDAKRDVN